MSKPKFLAFFLALSCAAPAYSQMFTLRHTLDDPTLTRGNFGDRVDIDGDRVLVSAWMHPLFNDSVGEAYLFDINTGNLLRTFRDPNISGNNGNNFGRFIDMDGDRILIGETGGDPGQAYLFDKATGNLLRTFDDPIPMGTADLGRGVSLEQDRVAVGEQVRVRIFNANTGDLIRTIVDPSNPFDSNTFGESIVYEDGKVLANDRNDNTHGDNIGQVYLFDAGSFSLLRTFDDPTPTERDNFGNWIAMDENHVLIGDRFDDTMGTDVGQAHLFDATTGQLLTTFNDPTPTDRDQFGRVVAIDGNRVLVGAWSDDTNGENQGQAYLFDLAGSLLQTFDDPTPTTQDNFGRRLAMQGNRIVIGAPGDDSQGEGVGQAHLFTAAASPDFNEDGIHDCADVDALVAEIAAATGSYSFDVTGDGVLNKADLDAWLAQAGAANLASGNPYLPGDANLDGAVDASDFNSWNSNRFSQTVAWCSGDFNADGAVDASDFNIWNSHKFTSSDGGAAVPEPSMGVIGIATLIGLATRFGTERRKMAKKMRRVRPVMSPTK